jgi:hypothetical protein
MVECTFVHGAPRAIGRHAVIGRPSHFLASAMEGERIKERRKKEERRKKKGKELWLVVAATPLLFAMHASSLSSNVPNSCWQLHPLCADITARSTSFGKE